MNQENLQRDYDKEPIIIDNNFTSLIIGIVFWFLFNILIINGVFFDNTIDWFQNKNWFYIFKEEIEKSPRFGLMIGLYIIANIGAFHALFKILKNPKTIKFKNKNIENSKNLNDLTQLILVDVQIIKKGFFPLILTGYKEKKTPYL